MCVCVHDVCAVDAVRVCVYTYACDVHARVHACARTTRIDSRNAPESNVWLSPNVRGTFGGAGWPRANAIEPLGDGRYTGWISITAGWVTAL